MDHERKLPNEKKNDNENNKDKNLNTNTIIPKQVHFIIKLKLHLLIILLKIVIQKNSSKLMIVKIKKMKKI